MTRGAHVRVLVLPEYRGWKPYPGSAEGGLDSIGIGTPELREGAGGWEVGGEPVGGGGEGGLSTEGGLDAERMDGGWSPSLRSCLLHVELGRLLNPKP